jgi:RHS repeat-associated protein
MVRRLTAGGARTVAGLLAIVRLLAVVCPFAGGFPALAHAHTHRRFTAACRPVLSCRRCAVKVLAAERRSTVERGRRAERRLTVSRVRAAGRLVATGRAFAAGRFVARGRGVAVGVSALVCVALVGAAATPAAAAGGDDRASSLVGGFGVGDGLEATIDPRDGAGMFSVPAAGLALHWDSRLIMAGDRTGFGPGWVLGVSSVGVDGGIRVVLPNGRVLDADSSSATGLAGYTTRDLLFVQHAEAALEARPDGSVGERQARFALHELGGTTTWYDAEGRAMRLDRGNGVSTAYTFTSTGEIASETTTHGGAMRSARSYEYDAHGALSTRVDRVVDEQGTETATTTTYTYDALNRLRGSRVHDGESADAPITREREYEVSVAGMITAEHVVDEPGTPEARTTERRFEYSATGELLALVTDGVRAEQAYDESGRLAVAADDSTLTYDAAGRPSSRRAGDTTTEYGYWADGSRRSLTTTDEATGRVTSTSYYWDGGTLLSEHHDEAGGDGAGTQGTASYLNAATRHSRTTISEGETEAGYYDTDRRGDVTALTDAAGETIERYAYDDYGVTTGFTVETGAGQRADDVARPGSGLDRNPFRYAGELQDPDGSYRLGGVRSYDPAARSFTTPDPADLFTEYAYADLNPIAKVDPTGRSAEDTGPEHMLGAVGWIGFGFSLIADAIIIASAIFTGGWSLTGLGIVNIAVQTTTATIAAIRIADAVAPDTITDEQSHQLAISDATIGIAGAILGVLQGVMAWAEGAAARMAFQKVEMALAKGHQTLVTTRTKVAEFRDRWAALADTRSRTIVAAMKGGAGVPRLPRDVAVKIADENFDEPARRLLGDIDAWRKKPVVSVALLEQGVIWAANDFHRQIRSTYAINRPFQSWNAKRWVDRAHLGLREVDTAMTDDVGAIQQKLQRVLPPTAVPAPIDAVLTLPT